MTIIHQMINKYELKTLEDKKNAIKEVLQEVVLAALSKTDFFNHAAFYGGTALRIFYGIDRFSEDLDFSLLASDESFDLNKYLKPISDVVHSMGLDFEIEKKEKNIESNIDSAFIKGNTKETFITIYPNADDFKQIINNEKIIIKFEVDVNPPLYANTELKYRLLPFPYQVRLYDNESLFASKIHAVIARSWKKRVKGRDLYDYLYYMGLNTKVNLKHLEARLKQTNTLNHDENLTKELLIKILNDRFDNIDYGKAKLDVRPFIKNASTLELWSSDFFKSITESIKS
ncbi:MAG: nucleotidyl transferase AbiEii/AbiGii toxin family protein [Bacilli bacterium]|jgi:predicted nucleotidyltransferase component of viral defense system|nr:nucleotidyl transferase AbiEii/AbiGii toxin family protein [Bacilli bacterium]MDY0064543.1 nucleotidyl transferase AbiEii/AbiGii toxin family protein [Bacilli bacterium]